MADYHVTESRAYDTYYDPYYRTASNAAASSAGYRVSLQSTDVAGSDRPLFFGNPTNNKITTPAIIATKQPPPPVQSPRETHEKVDVMVQTLYRESEAQTTPWLPETTQHTKPKQWFEEEELENLSLEERQQRLQEMEVERWTKREREIVEIQQERLNLLATNFQKREDEQAVIRQRRVENVLQDREAKREAAVEKKEKERLKILRTLTEQRRQMTKKPTKRDIISDYANKGSVAYAPLLRQGRAQAQAVMDRRIYGRRDIDCMLDITDLDAIEERYVQSSVAPLRGERTMKRSDRQQLDALKTVERTVQEKRSGVEKKVQTLKIAQRIERPPPRPATPEVKPGVEDDEREMAVILLQRLLKGRAMQSDMYRCLMNQRQLIRELRTVEALKEVEEVEATDEEKQLVQDAKAQMEKSQTVQGQVVGEMLSFLNHQLRRRLEERRLDAMMKLAERERRRREAEESGRREEELRRQAIEDESFRRVMGVNYETTESYLETIINSSIETAANELATENARQNAEKITRFTSTVANTRGDSAIVARDLVAAFLFPEVEKDSLRKHLRIEQKKYRRAADNTVKSISEKLN